MTRSKELQIIIAGAPASGKGTQCELIREAYNLVHLSTGDMLRAAKDEGSDLGKLAATYMDEGKLVPDEVIIGVVKDRLLQADCAERGWLLDGFPRTRAQAEALVSAGIVADAFVFLDVPDRLLVERVVGRRSDPETGKIYHLTFNPPPEEIKAKLVHREDDTEEKVKTRLQAFHANLAPILGVYKQVMLRVDGSGNKDAIFRRIKSRVDNLKRYSVVFVLGGPGSGKGTQCANIVRDFGYTHLSAGDLLRAEQASGSEVAEMIKKYIKEGQIVPVEVTVGLLKKAMEDSGNNRFLIDGFPRSQDNLDGWFNVMGDTVEVSFVLFFDCPEEVMTERLLSRGLTSGRADDNIESIKKRFVTFRDQSVPVVNAFGRLGKVRSVSSVPPPEVVFARVARIFRGLSILPGTMRTLAMIKPDAVAAGKEGEIVQRIKDAGFVVVARKQEHLSTERATAFYAEHQGKPFFEGLLAFMTSGPAVALCLEKVAAVPAWRQLMGPTNTAKAKETAPESLRALYGTDGTQNATHGSDSTQSALRELAFWFPEPFPVERTLAMIKPGAAELNGEAILDVLAARGFEVLKSSHQVMTPQRATEFYAEHEGKSFFPILVGTMTSGPMTALMLSRTAAIGAWRSLMGPTNSIKARETDPDSLRALFGVDGTRNATHGSDSPASAARECLFWFPDPRSAAAVAAGASGDAAGNGSPPEHQEMLDYMRDHVDPVFAPLLQRLLLSRPEDVVDFAVKELTAKKAAAANGGGGAASAH